MGMHELDQLLGLINHVGSADELVLAMGEVSKRLGFRYFALTHHVDILRASTPAIRLHNYPEDWAASTTRAGSACPTRSTAPATSPASALAGRACRR